MLVFVPALFLTIVKASKSEELIILDNFDYGGMTYGTEDQMVDYALLSLGRKMDLPPSFTICSSIHMNFMTTANFFFQLYQDDGKPWFNVQIENNRDLDTFEERVSLVYYEELGNIESNLDPLRIEPNSWYHACTSLNTVTGQMLIVVNGQIIIDQVISVFIDSTINKPKTLDGRLSLFKNNWSGVWYQSRQRLTNLNIHASAQTLDKMINLTAGEHCAEQGDYLSWKEAQWNVTGNIDHDSIVKKEDLCYRSTSNILMFTDKFLDWEECMLFCEKLPNTRSPSVASEKELLNVMRAAEKPFIDPETGIFNAGVFGAAYWIPITDSKIEGQWVDFYTSDPVDILGVAAGEPNGGMAENCGIVVTLWGGWQDWPCKLTKTSAYACPCEAKGPMYLTLRGLCPDTNIDKYFVPQNKDHDGRTMFWGLFKTIIKGRAKHIY